MITIGDKQFRNLEEQVRRNQEDIQFILEEEGVLNQFGIKVVGQVDTEAELPDASTYQGDYGDAYAVGTQPPYELYIYTREFSGETGPQWFNIGKFPAPSTVPGPTGAVGPTGPTGQRGSKWTSSTSLPGEGAGTAGVAGDQYLYVGSNLSYNGNVYQYGTGGWELQGNIRGPQGIQGIQGPIGPTGPKGDVGPQGATGPVGQSFQIIGVLTTSSQLPDPSTVPDSYAYLVGSTENYDLYVQVVGENEWVNVGKVEGVVGPQGPVGPTGTTGPAGIVYIKPVESNVIPVAGKGYNLLAMREFSSTPKVGDYFLLIWKGILDIEGRTWATIQEVTEIDGTRVRSVPSGVVETTGAQGEAGPMGPTGPSGATGPQGPQGEAGAGLVKRYMHCINFYSDDDSPQVKFVVYSNSAVPFTTLSPITSFLMNAGFNAANKSYPASGRVSSSGNVWGVYTNPVGSLFAQYGDIQNGTPIHRIPFTDSVIDLGR